MDTLLQKFFETDRWTHAIDVAVDKGIDQSLLRRLCEPDGRMEVYHAIRDGKYVVAPPHEAQIPKDDGTMRTVYVNEDVDRVVLSIVNDMFFELCPELVHPRCQSYQKGIGCGWIVKDMSRRIRSMDANDIGVKVDLSKYFDTVPREYIDEVFDYVDAKFGASPLTAMVRTYYHTDTVIDMQKNLVEKYSSLRQGCAVAAFLADAVLRDVDSAISDSGMDVEYVRYSDDILIIGPDWRKAFSVLSSMLAAKSLVLNPKKIEYLTKDKWFTFLGFSMKDDRISLSRNRVRAFQAEIEKRTVEAGPMSLKQAVGNVNAFLYRGNGKYSWATSVLPIVNVDRDVQLLNGFVMDAIRGAVLGRGKIGGLGVAKDCGDHIVQRGPGRNVASNRQRMPVIDGYMTVGCMQKALLTSKEAYEALVRSL